jgi:hypothetical protein
MTLRETVFRGGCGLFLFFAPSLWSATVYTYTGPHFDHFEGSPAVGPDNNITASFTTAALLPPGFSGTPSLISWSISDGVHALSPTSVDLTFFSLTINTDATASIQSWTFYAAAAAVPFALSTWHAGTGGQDNFSMLPVGQAWVDSPGQWQASSVPEPTTWPLMIGVVAIATRRYRCRKV